MASKASTVSMLTGAQYAKIKSASEKEGSKLSSPTESCDHHEASVCMSSRVRANRSFTERHERYGEGLSKVQMTSPAAVLRLRSHILLWIHDECWSSVLRGVGLYPSRQQQPVVIRKANFFLRRPSCVLVNDAVIALMISLILEGCVYNYTPLSCS